MHDDLEGLRRGERRSGNGRQGRDGCKQETTHEKSSNPGGLDFRRAGIGLSPLQSS